MNLPPLFDWGGRIGAAPPNQRYPGWLNINRTQDFAVSLTKVMGRHTMKAGFYNNHSFKAQNSTPAAASASRAPSTSATTPTTCSTLASATPTRRPGVFTQYHAGPDFIEGSMIYNNTEFYIQDNWKASNRLTLDYGMRFTRQQPQYDQFQQMSNFFPEQW